jgi:hypothetical protein
MELVFAIVIIVIVFFGASVLVPEFLNVIRRIFGESVVVTGKIVDKYTEQNGKRQPDDHVSYSIGEESRGSWFVIGETHLKVTYKYFGKFNVGDIVTAKLVGDRAIRVSSGADPNAKPIETHEEELTDEAEARNRNERVSLIGSIFAENHDTVVQVNGMTDEIHMDDKLVGKLSSRDHDVCGSPLVFQEWYVYMGKGDRHFCFDCEVVVK